MKRATTLPNLTTLPGCVRKLHVSWNGNDEKEAALSQSIPGKGTSKSVQCSQCRVSEEVNGGRWDQSGGQGHTMKGPMGWIRRLDFPWLLWGAWSTRSKTRTQETEEEAVVVTYWRVDGVWARLSWFKRQDWESVLELDPRRIADKVDSGMRKEAGGGDFWRLLDLWLEQMSEW